MTNSVKTILCEKQKHFSTIKENRKLKLIEADYNIGLRNFRYADCKTKQNKATSAEVFLRALPWIIVGLAIALWSL